MMFEVIIFVEQEKPNDRIGKDGAAGDVRIRSVGDSVLREAANRGQRANDQERNEPAQSEIGNRREAERDTVNGGQKSVFGQYAPALFAGAVLDGEYRDCYQVEQR